MSKRLIVLMALACGLAIACNYFVQPLIKTIGIAYGVNPHRTGLFISLSQVAFVTGILFVVPLGDLLDNKKLIISMFSLMIIGLLVVAFSPNLTLFLVGLIMVGLFATVAQILIPLASSLAAENEKGEVVAKLITGLSIGILIANTFSGTVAYFLNWRMVYVLGAIIVLCISIALYFSIPDRSGSKDSNTNKLSYYMTLRTTRTLLFHNRLVRERSIVGALAFSTVTAMWASLTLLLSNPPYHYSLFTIGFFGLLGIIGAFGALYFGKYANRGWAFVITSISAFIALASWLIMFFGVYSVIPLIIGIIGVNFTFPLIHITNQILIYRSDPIYKGRVTAAYMSSVFFGGIVGSVGSSFAYVSYGWHGVSIFGITLSILLIIISFIFKTEKFA